MSWFKSMSFSNVNSESNQELVNQNQIVFTNPYWYPVLVVVYVVICRGREIYAVHAADKWLKSVLSAMIILSMPSSTEMDQLSEWISNYYCWQRFNLANWFAYWVQYSWILSMWFKQGILIAQYWRYWLRVCSFMYLMCKYVCVPAVPV